MSLVKVVHVCKMKGIGGCENQLLDLLPGLRENGLGIELIILEEKAHPMAELAARFRARGVPTTIVPIFRDFDIGLIVRLARRFRAMGAEMVHTHLIHADLHGTLAARLAGVSRVVSTRHSAHRFYEDRVLVRLLDAAVGRLAGRAVSISEFARRYYISLGIFPERKSVCIPYGVKLVTGDPATAARLRREAGAVAGSSVVTLVSRLIPGKGHDLFLKAAAALAAESGADYRFWIVGDGPLRETLERNAAALGAAAAVRFWGFRSDVSDLLLASDIVCVPTSPALREGLNLVLLEAGAAARPCVASRMGPFPEIVEDGSTGVLFEPDDARGLADAIRRLSAAPALRRDMGEKARARIAQNFSLERSVNGYTAVYQELR